MAGFTKILVANRGEIALRVMRSARAAGYATVAVFSDADSGMPHVAAADQAVPIGPAPAAQSYLAIDRIIAAARRAGADAIHPGYGFLSENADFAEACSAADIVFIGPPPEAIRLMGNKAAAKKRMAAAGIPILQGYEGGDQSDAAFAAAATTIGFPLMVKAAAGGGGKGMRLVRVPGRLPDDLRAARSEALKAFGSDELILEKAVTEPRHVEIQIFGDRHGNLIHLGERDCSIQRRHQKVIEEAPAPGISPDIREAMGKAAIAVASAIGYVGAGTVEFLLADDGGFAFLEMNTRLQVEHPVTEMVTGLDLVDWQLRIAAGEPLALRQADIAVTGHAIEARLYAEDSAADFLPQAGQLAAWEVASGAGIRVDHGVAPGVAIAPYYDPMIAKVIAHGASREEARRRLIGALDRTVALGIPTNRQFLVDCLAHPAFVAGGVSTSFIEKYFPPSARQHPAPDQRMAMLAAAMIYAHSAIPWHGGPSLSSPLLLQCGEQRWRFAVRRAGERRYEVAGEGARGVIEIVALDGVELRFLADGLQDRAQAAWDGDVLHLRLGEVTAGFTDASFAAAAGGSTAETQALAPMTGTIAAVNVRPGDAVRKGQCLAILEAMKLEHEILSPRDGEVAAVLVAPGEQVMARRLLVELAPAGKKGEEVR